MTKTGIIGLILVVFALAGCASVPEATPSAAAPSGSQADLYPPQDLSIIAKTNRVQFLNVYANW